MDIQRDWTDIVSESDSEELESDSDNEQSNFRMAVDADPDEAVKKPLFPIGPNSKGEQVRIIILKSLITH